MQDYEMLNSEIVTNGRDRLEIILFKTPNNRHLIQINQTDVINKDIQNLIKIGAKNLPGVIRVLQNTLEKIEKTGQSNQNWDANSQELVEKENAIIKQYLDDMVPIKDLAVRFSMRESEIIEMFNLRGISMAPAKYVSPNWSKRRRKK